MPGWEPFVDVIRHLLFVLAHLFGGSFGSAIIALSIGDRLLLLPLTVRAALRVRAQQARVASIQQEIDALRARHARDARKLADATRALYRQHGISLLPGSALLTAVIQMPLGAGLYQAIRTSAVLHQAFAWVADLARPDGFVAALVALLAAVSALAASLGQPATTPSAMNPVYLAAAVSGVTTLWFVYRLSSGVGLYWAASSSVGILQSVLVNRIERARVAVPVSP